MIRNLGKATEAEAAAHIAKNLAEFKGIAAGTVKVLALPALAGLAQYLFSRKNIKQEIEALKKSYTQITSESDILSANKDLAAQRFQELSAIAPVVAMNPKMATKFLEPRLEEGLTIDDVHKLTTIQAHHRPSIFSRTPKGEAFRSAGFVADRVFNAFGPQMYYAGSDAVSRVVKNNQEFSSMLGARNMKAGATMNKQSSQNVSEECVAEMLADRYVIWREAGFTKTANAGRVMAEGAGNFGKGLAFFAAPLAIAGLVHGAGALMDAKRKRDMDRDADAAFEKIKKDSEIIQGNMHVAHEALDAMKTFAPALAAKPNILKTFIEHTISAGGRMPVQTVNELSSTQSNAHKAKSPGFAQGFFGAMTPALSAGKSITDTGEKQ